MARLLPSSSDLHGAAGWRFRSHPAALRTYWLSTGQWALRAKRNKNHHLDSEDVLGWPLRPTLERTHTLMLDPPVNSPTDHVGPALDFPGETPSVPAKRTRVRTRKGEPQLVVIDSRTDAAYLHDCGAYVSPSFSGSGVTVYCPKCKRSV